MDDVHPLARWDGHGTSGTGFAAGRTWRNSRSSYGSLYLTSAFSGFPTPVSRQVMFGAEATDAAFSLSRSMSLAVTNAIALPWLGNEHRSHNAKTMPMVIDMRLTLGLRMFEIYQYPIGVVTCPGSPPRSSRGWVGGR